MVLIADILPHWLWHPLGVCAGSAKQVLQCRSYAFWSGIGSDFGELTLVISAITGLVLLLRFYKTHLTCHVTTCNRPALHPVIGTPYRTCAPHHPTVPDDVITPDHIAQAHADAHPHPDV